MTAPARLPAHWTPTPVDEALAREAGVLTASQQVDTLMVARQLRRGVWKRYGRAVVMHNGPLTYDQQLWVALIRAPSRTVLSGPTVLHEVMTGWPRPTQIHLLTVGTTLADVPGARARRTTVLGPEDVHPTAQPPRLRLPRAVGEHLRDLDDRDEIRKLLSSPVQRRLTTVPQLAAAVERAALRGRRLQLAHDTLGSVGQGAQSHHEIAFAALIESGGLPRPDRQVWRTGRNGRRCLDAEWEEWSVHAEIDGMGHLELASWSDDIQRTNELELERAWRRRLRFPGFWLTERPDDVLDQLRRALRAGGWPG
jgi:hypothetical protein